MKYSLVTFIARRLTQSFKKEKFIRFTKGVALVSVMLGSMALMTDVIAAELPNHAVVALSGPSFAAEVAPQVA